MTRFLNKIPGGILFLPAMIIFLTLISCNSFLFEELPPCVVINRLQIRFTKNILNTDAFGSQVSKVNLAIYDSEKKLVALKKIERELTETNDFYIDLEMAAGRYTMIAWCEGESVTEQPLSFQFTGENAGSSIEDSGAIIPLEKNSSDQLISDRDLKPLYYGYLKDVEIKDDPGINMMPVMYLTKDTNHIIIQIQNINGNEIDPSLLNFEIEGANSVLNWENLSTGTPLFSYLPWSRIPTYAVTQDTDDKEPVGNASKGNEGNVISGVQAEFTLSRIMADKEQYLTIRRTDTGENIFRIPMVEYLLMVRGKYEQASDAQDYLDRFDNFTMVFFIDDHYSWMNAKIFINGWRVVPPQTGII